MLSFVTNDDFPPHLAERQLVPPKSLVGRKNHLHLRKLSRVALSLGSLMPVESRDRGAKFSEFLHPIGDKGLGHNEQGRLKLSLFVEMGQQRNHLDGFPQPPPTATEE